MRSNLESRQMTIHSDTVVILENEKKNHKGQYFCEGRLNHINQAVDEQKNVF